MHERKHVDEVLRCSFCRNTQDVAGKLIASSGEYSRAYICEDCVMVCNSIIEDGKRQQEPDESPPREAGRFVNSPLAAEFLLAAENWAVRDLAGWHALDELNGMRILASRMLAEELPKAD